MKSLSEKIRLLLICGAGASSSFMAAKMRAAAKNRGINLSITARSESEIENYLGEIDVLMVGPHLATYYDMLKNQYQEDFPVILMEHGYYSGLDGEKALDHLFAELDRYGKTQYKYKE